MRILADLLLITFFLGVLSSPVALSYLCTNPALLQFNSDSPGGAAIRFGGQDLTISLVGGGTGVFTMEAFTCTQFDSDWIVLNNSVGNPARQKGQQKVPEYETTLQDITSSTAKCPLGFSIVTLIDMAGQSTSWIVARVVGSGGNDGNATKYTVLLRYKLN
jgi:hypothetical protein